MLCRWWWWWFAVVLCLAFEHASAVIRCAAQWPFTRKHRDDIMSLRWDEVMWHGQSKVAGYMSLGPGFIESRVHCVPGSLSPRFIVSRVHCVPGSMCLQLVCHFCCNFFQLCCNFYATFLPLFATLFCHFWQLFLQFFATCFATCKKLPKSCQKVVKQVATNLQNVAKKKVA